MKNVLGLIIAFDTDNDLRELTDHRTVAAVPVGSRYRIVDFMLSNMVNSGIYRIGLLMKDKYQSLIKVASVDLVMNEKTDEILSFEVTPVE